MVSKRMDIIRKKQEIDGLDNEIIDFLSQSTRSSTQRIYDSGWKRWVEWCAHQTPEVIPEEYQPMQVVRYLLSIKHQSPQTLNVARGAQITEAIFVPSTENSTTSVVVTESTPIVLARLGEPIPHLSSSLRQLPHFIQAAVDVTHTAVDALRSPETAVLGPLLMILGIIC
ncbi:hypothetical protein PHYBLDRAFT_176393 [Phycomyces blakesleeanus NRRL 1555(-)]|uniref:Core-binding (CB) domain-containing protein n=1 Tax=Phycomyces blakesleeanus (strain ATCC 8743b / DSM 1359 / FGSC 10004 / NBRC 33097 / NRRL 1555) TaxID=763407 RepID=A0A167J504_PHYB8|nr:hypothetical protein PHYBLDRAFT_176393 [Phycomyces blakesleeanus NRRL 1555(-)]OAD65159.1 hypothetical protein PHYBLDRAFT_176393 [Phycomyces blakesleeanus NRRL 1555(-)]|eukprot:XP_018283199.1 hypothetical protein PHYBLDRAFT_176393 [Phycomyces blakesleeanus NRRL 1555(-)]